MTSLAAETLTFPDYPTLLGRAVTGRQSRMLERARAHAADFATRAAEHDRDNTYPLENFEAMKESNYLFATLPEKFGGEDATLLELCASQEQLARGCAGTAIAANMHIFVLGAMQFDSMSGDEAARAQTEMMMQMVGSQKLVMCGSFSETGTPGAYFLPSTTATKVEGGWRVNGRKSYNSNYPAAAMVGFLVRIEDGSGEPKVAMTFLPKDSTGLSSPGASSWDVMGVRASGSYDLVLEDAFVPDAMMPPPTPATQTFGLMAAFGAWFSMTVSAVYLGVAQAAVEVITDYIKTRKPPTEERPLSHMAGMQYQLAEMLALQEASRGIIKRSADDWMTRPWTTEEAQPRGATCKYIVSNNNQRVVSLAMDMAGGPGLFRSTGLERLYRDVRAHKAHPPSDMVGLESIAKSHLGIAMDFRPRWG